MTDNKHKAQQILVGDDAESPTVYRERHIGRNEPCPCGSGKKAKNCCGTATRYRYKKLKLKVTPEEELGPEYKRFKFPFRFGEVVACSKAFPVEEMRGKNVMVVRRGIEKHIGSFYFKIEAIESEDAGKFDNTLWYADGHLEWI